MPTLLSRKVNPVGLKYPEPNVPVNPRIRAATKHHSETAKGQVSAALTGVAAEET
jgi:hypothetical protein